jgi:hypothetical protein
MIEKATYWQALYEQSQQVNLENMQVDHMEVNHHLDIPALVNTRLASWLPSPAKGVKRLMLEREGGEKVSRATSIVAYAPNSQFSSHSHPKGEEFYVLFGTFSDEHGDYPAGSYVRNPPSSAHKPFSREGCLIWVKLQQFEPVDSQHIVIDTEQNRIKNDKQCDNENILFNDYEQVSIIEPTDDQVLPVTWLVNGIEILVLSGVLQVNNSHYQQGHWLRYPANSEHFIVALAGCRLLIKVGHLGSA